MLILSPVLILLLSTLILAIAAWIKPKAAYLWLIAAVGTLISWIMAWIIKSQIGESAVLLNWGEMAELDFSPSLILDEISWPFVLILSTLILGVILTEVGRSGETDFSSWIGSMLIASIGILAVMSKNIETLLLLWVVIDILDLVLILLRVRGKEKQQGVIIYFSTSLLGTMLVLFAGIISYTQNIHLTFENVTPEINLFLILAVGLRLGVLPLQAPFMKDPAQQRGLGTIIKLILPAVSLVLLVRIANAGVPASVRPYLLLLAGMASVYGAIAWARSRDEIRGRRFWILSLASFAIAAAILGKPLAVLSWSLLLIATGALIFLASVHTRSRMIIVLIGIIGITTLPYTASQSASSLYSAPFNSILIVFIVAQAILISGYFRHAIRSGKSFSGVEPWVRAVFPIGLMLILFSHWISGLNLFLNNEIKLENNLIWPGIVSILLSGIIIFLSYRKVEFPSLMFSGLDTIFSLSWFYKLTGKLFNIVSLILNFFTNLIEGKGGILWAILLISLIFTFLFQLAGS